MKKKSHVLGVFFRRAISILLIMAIGLSCIQSAVAYSAGEGERVHDYVASYGYVLYQNEEINTYFEKIRHGVRHEDEVDLVYDQQWPCVTETHFWDADKAINDPVDSSICTAVENAWQKAHIFWGMALGEYANGDKNQAYEYLGHIAHLLADMTVPAHAHEDPHPDRDCYEDWMTEEKAALDQADWEYINSLGWFEIPDGPRCPLFRLFYTANQIGDFFASEDRNGDANDNWGGWMHQIYSELGMDSIENPPTIQADLVNNYWPVINDIDGDLSTIRKYCYLNAIRATAALYKLFYETAKQDPALTVVIERIVALDDHDESIFGGEADFYVEIYINGKKFINEGNQKEDNDTVYPNWAFAQDVGTSGNAQVRIRVIDDDDPDPHQRSDINPYSDLRRLDLVVNLETGAISGDVIGMCGTSLSIWGTQEYRSNVTFRILWPRKPDLTYADDEFAGFHPNTVVRNETDFQVEARVRNVGTASSGNFNVDFVLSKASSPKYLEPSDFIFASVYISESLAPLDSIDVSWSGVFPIQAGTLDGVYPLRINQTIGSSGYFVYLIIRSEYIEFNKDNNIQCISEERLTVKNHVPTAEIGGPYHGTVGLPVVFDGSASHDPDGAIKSYEWDFGDGNSGTGKKPQHTYTQIGDYLVSLTITDDSIPSSQSYDSEFVIINSPLCWNTGTVDPDENARGPSLALDSNDNPHISYRTDEDLKYARYDGSVWLTETVDSPNRNWKKPSLALDSNDNPHISYHDAINIDLKYAWWDGSTWNIETIPDPTEKVGWYSSLALDSNDNPHISYYDLSNYDLKYAWWDGSTWNIETIPDPTEYVGEYSSLALDSNDNPHISYRDPIYADLKYAWWDGSTWNIEMVDSNGIVGRECSLALDSNDNPHISYYDTTNNALKHAMRIGLNWEIRMIDTGIDVGRGSSIALDSSDNVHISYYDGTNRALKYARMTPKDSLREYEIWVIDEARGSYTSLALDSLDKPHISFCYYSLRFTFLPPPLIIDIEASDSNGNFILSIDAEAEKGAPVTSWSVITTTNIAPSYEITQTNGELVIHGQLDDPSREGKIILDVDPEGRIINYELNIIPYQRNWIKSLLTTEVAIIATVAIIVIVGVVVYWVLRRRK